MKETAFDLLKMEREEWDKLTQSEKALCINYKRQLESGYPVKNILIIKINAIHEIHPDFHVGCIPG